MPQYCSVPLCTNSGGHLFPTDPVMLRKWRVSINRKDPKTKELWNPKLSHDVVCGKHFLGTDYQEPLCVVDGKRKRKRLLKSAVPSVFSFKETKKSKSSLERDERMEKKQKKEEESLMAFNNLSHELIVETEMDIEENMSTSSLGEDFKDAVCQTFIETKEEQSQTVGTLKITGFCLEDYKNDDEAIQYFTGFDNYRHFRYLFDILGEAVYHLDCKCEPLTPEDMLFLTLMKLRQAEDHKKLAILFRISTASVSKIVNTWICFMYFQLKEVRIWASRKTINDHMPVNFKAKFPKTRVILDATEIPIEKPSNVNFQSQTFSTYKNCNTIKSMIGITPRGAVSFVSDCYGGSASDRQVIEDCPLYKESESHFCPGDSIMADRGIMVQDLFAVHDVHVNTPTMLRGKTQLNAEDVIRDRRIASKRIHVERVIGLAKTFKILKRKIPYQLIHLSSKITFICFVLTNLRPSIVSCRA